jgi:hypothetical protein
MTSIAIGLCAEGLGRRQKGADCLAERLELRQHLRGRFPRAAAGTVVERIVVLQGIGGRIGARASPSGFGARPAFEAGEAHQAEAIALGQTGRRAAQLHRLPTGAVLLLRRAVAGDQAEEMVDLAHEAHHGGVAGRQLMRQQGGQHLRSDARQIDGHGDRPDAGALGERSDLGARFFQQLLPAHGKAPSVRDVHFMFYYIEHKRNCQGAGRFSTGQSHEQPNPLTRHSRASGIPGQPQHRLPPHQVRGRPGPPLSRG